MRVSRRVPSLQMRPRGPGDCSGSGRGGDGGGDPRFFTASACGPVGRRPTTPISMLWPLGKRLWKHTRGRPAGDHGAGDPPCLAGAAGPDLSARLPVLPGPVTSATVDPNGVVLSRLPISSGFVGSRRAEGPALEVP